MPETEPLRPDDPPVVGPYRLAGRLGKGGQGVVYLGHADDGTAVAVKVLHEDIAAEPRVRERFTKEIAAARRIEPFCIAQVLDASMDGPRPYIATEYVEGPSLEDAGPKKGAALQRLAVATATALAAIHEAGVVHRDFKPSNVLLGPDGPRVIDFGIARDTTSPMTVTNTIIGTPAYMAPEQFAGEGIGAPADVFAWGVVMAYASSGKPSFGTDTFPAIMNRVLQGEPDLDGLPGPLRATVASCLAKDPAERPTMRAVLLKLLGAQTSEAEPQESAVPAAPPPPPAPASDPVPDDEQDSAQAEPVARATGPVPSDAYDPDPVPDPQPTGPVPPDMLATGPLPPDPRRNPPRRLGGAPTPAGPGARPAAAGRGQGSGQGTSRRRPALLLGTGAVGAVAVAVLAGLFVWGGWPQGSGAAERDTAGPEDVAGGSGGSPQNGQVPGIAVSPKTGASRTATPSERAGSPTPGKGRRSGTARPTGGRSSRPSTARPATPGGGGGGGGGGEPVTARISSLQPAKSPDGPDGKCYVDRGDFTYAFTSGGPSTTFKWSNLEDGVVSETRSSSSDADGTLSMSGTATFDTPGEHTVTVKLLGPGSDQRSLSFTIC